MTTYDATAYNLIVAISGQDKRPPCFNCEKVRTNNKKYFKDDSVGNVIADISIFGFIIKAKDNAEDGDPTKAFFANMLFHKLFEKTVSAHRPLFDATCETIREMDKLQRANGPIDDVLALYAKSVEDSFRYFFKADDSYFRCINQLARWTFLLDMIEDYDEDRRFNRPNSLNKEDSPTLGELFDKHYFELIPFFKKEINDFNDALLAIKDDSYEWIVLNKLARHSMATLIPDVLNGKDISFHYFKNTYTQTVQHFDRKKTAKKYEKNTTDN